MAEDNSTSEKFLKCTFPLHALQLLVTDDWRGKDVPCRSHIGLALQTPVQGLHPVNCVQGLCTGGGWAWRRSRPTSLLPKPEADSLPARASASHFTYRIAEESRFSRLSIRMAVSAAAQLGFKWVTYMVGYLETGNHASVTISPLTKTGEIITGTNILWYFIVCKMFLIN